MNIYKKVILGSAFAGAMTLAPLAFAMDSTVVVPVPKPPVMDTTGIKNPPLPMPPIKVDGTKDNNNGGEMHALDGVVDGNSGYDVKAEKKAEMQAKMFTRAQTNFTKESTQADSREVNIAKKLEDWASKGKDVTAAKVAYDKAKAEMDAAQAAGVKATDKAGVDSARKLIKKARVDLDKVLRMKIKNTPKPNDGGTQTPPIIPVPAPKITQ